MRLHRLIGSAAAVAAALLPPAAAADSVYHSEHLRLTPVAGAPLRSGFVENIKAEGARVYAHEIFVLNGAGARTTYKVTRNFSWVRRAPGRCSPPTLRRSRPTRAAMRAEVSSCGLRKSRDSRASTA
jgi:hypothetical protein